MHSPKSRTLPPIDRATRGELEQALQHWDELEDTALVALASHPTTAKRLAGLRAVERWMSEQGDDDRAHGSSTGAAGECPTAEALFDFGRGPGFRDLDEEFEERIASHLADCGDCAQLVRTLQTPPPLPLDSSPFDEEPLRGPGAFPEPARPLRSTRVWRPFLVAAGLIGVLLVPMYFSGSSPSLDDLPRSPIYRGAEPLALHYPRGPVLALPTADGATTVATPNFELAAAPGATEYRVDVFQHDGSAFDSGVRLQRLRSDEPSLRAGALAPGHYTWRAWAQVDGLEHDLGALEFRVVSNPKLAARVVALDSADHQGRRLEVILELHEEGFVSDAHALALELPASPERDAYLSPPAR